MGSDYLIEIDDENRLIFAANLDRQTLDEVKQKLTAQAKALWTDLFDNHFEQYETILSSEKDANRRWVRVVAAMTMAPTS